MGISAGVVALALLAASPDAQRAANLRAAILLRAMAYERGLATKHDDLRIAVLQGAPGEAGEEGALMRGAFDGLATSVKVAGRKLVLVNVSYGGDDGALASLQAVHADLVYVP